MLGLKADAERGANGLVALTVRLQLTRDKALALLGAIPDQEHLREVRMALMLAIERPRN